MIINTYFNTCAIQIKSNFKWTWNFDAKYDVSRSSLALDDSRPDVRIQWKRIPLQECSDFENITKHIYIFFFCSSVPIQWSEDFFVYCQKNACGFFGFVDASAWLESNDWLDGARKIQNDKTMPDFGGKSSGFRWLFKVNRLRDTGEQMSHGGQIEGIEFRLIFFSQKISFVE